MTWLEELMARTVNPVDLTAPSKIIKKVLPDKYKYIVDQANAYNQRLGLAVANVAPVSDTILDLASDEQITQDAAFGEIAGRALKNAPLRYIGKILNLPDKVDDAVELYNAILNRPPEKKIAPYFDEKYNYLNIFK